MPALIDRSIDIYNLPFQPYFYIFAAAKFHHVSTKINKLFAFFIWVLFGAISYKNVLTEITMTYGAIFYAVTFVQPPWNLHMGLSRSFLNP